MTPTTVSYTHLQLFNHCYRNDDFPGCGQCLRFAGGSCVYRRIQGQQSVSYTHLLLETDCPYMAPEPHRGTRNDSSNIPYVISKIAEIKGTTPDEVERTTRANAFELFTRVNN